MNYKNLASIGHRASSCDSRPVIQYLLQGVETRASLDMSGMNGINGVGNMPGMYKMMGGAIRNGRVIVGLPDPALVNVFRAAFQQLPASIEFVPAVGPENVWGMCQQVCHCQATFCHLVVNLCFAP
jgi:hypothetical protein